MSVYASPELAFRKEKVNDRHPLEIAHLARLALKAVRQKAQEKVVGQTWETPEDLAARLEALGAVESIATPLIDVLTHRIGRAKELRAERTRPDGGNVSLEHFKATTLTQKGKLIDENPSYGIWNLSTSAHDGSTLAYQIRLEPSYSKLQPEITWLDDGGKIRQMYERDITQETTDYQQMAGAMNFLAGGIKDNSLKVTTSGESPMASIHTLDQHSQYHEAPLAKVA